MEIKRKQKVLRQRFWFRAIVCVLSVIGSVLYLFHNSGSSAWGVTIGICGSALVWSLVELVDFVVQTFYQFESERNVFFRIISEHFSKMKAIIRANEDEIPMHEIKAIVYGLYDEMNNFIFSSNIYTISEEFAQCSNYIVRMYWKFYACCAGIHEDCEEKTEYYNKLYDALLVVKEEKEKSSKRFFDGLFMEKSMAEITDIDLCFDKYQVPENLMEEGVKGNISETFTVPGNVRITTTFKPDLDFYDTYRNKKANAFCTTLCLLFRKVTTI